MLHILQMWTSGKSLPSWFEVVLSRAALGELMVSDADRLKAPANESITSSFKPAGEKTINSVFSDQYWSPVPA